MYPEAGAELFLKFYRLDSHLDENVIGIVIVEYYGNLRIRKHFVLFWKTFFTP